MEKIGVWIFGILIVIFLFLSIFNLFKINNLSKEFLNFKETTNSEINVLKIKDDSLQGDISILNIKVDNIPSDIFSTLSNCKEIETVEAGTTNCNERCVDYNPNMICTKADEGRWDTTLNKWIFHPGTHCSTNRNINPTPFDESGLILQCLCCTP